MHMKIIGRLKAAALGAAGALLLGGTAQAQDIMSMVAQANAQLRADGKNFVLESAVFVTDLESDEVGREQPHDRRPKTFLNDLYLCH